MHHRVPILRRFMLASVVSVAFLSGCSLPSGLTSKLPGNRAFITYWPPAEDSGQLRLAVKDNIDVKGVVTTAGSEYFAKNRPPAAKDAPCLAIARQRNVQIVGKTNLSEFAVAPSGFNEYFGTPKNPMSGWRRLIPGGSSCGSAVAVATGMADVAFGTDTAGSGAGAGSMLRHRRLEDKRTDSSPSMAWCRSSPRISIPSGRWGRTSRIP